MTSKHPSMFFALFCAFACGGAALAGDGVPRQDAQASAPTTDQSRIDQQIQMLRQDLRSQRKQLIAANMNLTGAEAEKFWPVYDQYVADLVKNNSAKYELIKEYAQTDTMSDQQAGGLAKRWLDVDESVVQLRLRYLPKFQAVLSPKQTARFYQLDRRVQMMIDLQLASSLPLVGP